MRYVGVKETKSFEHTYESLPKFCSPDVIKNVASRQAAAWFKEAASQGQPLARLELGLMYQDGRGGLEIDLDQASTLLQEAAGQDEARAQFALGRLYAEGVARTADLPQALNWYTRAANLGHAEARRELGLMYARGLGVPANPNQANSWLTQAAEQGDSEAQIQLGHMQLQAIAVREREAQLDAPAMLAWFSKAAANGRTDALLQALSNFNPGEALKLLDQQTDWPKVTRDETRVRYLLQRDLIAPGLQAAMRLLADDAYRALPVAQQSALRQRLLGEWQFDPLQYQLLQPTQHWRELLI